MEQLKGKLTASQERVTQLEEALKLAVKHIETNCLMCDWYGKAKLLLASPQAGEREA